MRKTKIYLEREELLEVNLLWLPLMHCRIRTASLSGPRTRLERKQMVMENLEWCVLLFLMELADL